MRLAQRTYRAKKADALALAEDKMHKLEHALSGISFAFETLQLRISETQNVTPAVNLYVSTAALDIATYTKDCGVGACFGRGYAQRDFLPDNLFCATKIVGERSFCASLGRTASMLAAGQPISTRLRPLMLEYLLEHRDKPMSADMMRQFISDSGYVRRDVPMPRPFGNDPPALYRLVEGAHNSSMVPRLAPPHLQRLEYGLTRTWVETNLPGLMGEWLEAVDVEEYLAARGIFLHDDSRSSLINLELKMPVAGGSPVVDASSPEKWLLAK